MRRSTAKKRKRKTLKRRSPIAASLRSRHLRQRKVPGKKRIKLEAWEPHIVRALFAVERF